MYDESYLEELFQEWWSEPYDMPRWEYMGLTQDELEKFMKRQHLKRVQELDKKKKDEIAEQDRLFKLANEAFAKFAKNGYHDVMMAIQVER